MPGGTAADSARGCPVDFCARRQPERRARLPGFHPSIFGLMQARRYTFVIADRQTGAVRRLTISLWPTLAAVAGVFALPVLIGLGARWSAFAAINDLQTNNAALQVENASYREATGQL